MGGGLVHVFERKSRSPLVKGAALIFQKHRLQLRLLWGLVVGG